METNHICECCFSKEIKIKYVKCTYNESQKRAIQNYQNKNPNKNKENAKAYYHRMKENEEWKLKYNERMKNNARLRKEKKAVLGKTTENP